MPLYPGKKNVGKNILTELRQGKPRKQAVAIAMHKRKSHTKRMTAGEPGASKHDVMRKYEHGNPKHMRSTY